MTTPVGGSNTPISGVLGQPSTVEQNTKDTRGTSEMDKDTFLKLLVAQMKYQDPSKPMDSAAMMAQNATFTQVEKMQDLVKGQQDMLNAQMLLGASNLVGKTVTFTGANGAEVTGVVSSATVSGSSPTLKVGNTDVPLSSVKEVRNS